MIYRCSVKQEDEGRGGDYGIFGYEHTAIELRLLMLCAARDMNTYELAQRARISPGSLYSILSKKSRNPSIRSIHKLCAGLDITMKEFFHCDIFRELEQEIR